MLYRKSQVSDRWLRAPLQTPTALHQPLSYITRSHIADVFASQENRAKGHIRLLHGASGDSAAGASRADRAA